MYRIFIKKNMEAGRLYEVYGTFTYSGRSMLFTPYETEDLEELKAKVLELDREYGFDNLMIVKDVGFEMSVVVADDTSGIPGGDGTGDGTGDGSGDGSGTGGSGTGGEGGGESGGGSGTGSGGSTTPEGGGTETDTGDNDVEAPLP